MATFVDDDSTDEEIGVNLQLAARLSINRGENGYSKNRNFTEKDHKQMCNQKKKNIYREKSSSSSSLEFQNEACCSGYTGAYGPHNKKRQNGDKNVEPLGNPKRSCLSDRFGPPENKYSKPKSSNGDINCLRKKDKNSSKPSNLMKQSLYPDNTYEDNVNKFSDDDSDFEPWRPFMRSKKVNNEDRLRKVKKQGNAKPEHPENKAPSQNGIQLVDSTSEDDSRPVIQNGALKGGRQSPELGSFRKVLGRKLKKVIESDDESEGNNWQRGYRNRRYVFSSSDSSDDSGPSNKVKIPQAVDLNQRKFANSSFSPLNQTPLVYHESDSGPSNKVKIPKATDLNFCRFSNYSPRNPTPLVHHGSDVDENPHMMPKQNNHRGRPNKTSRPHSSNRTLILPSEFENGASSHLADEGPSRHAGSSHSRHHYPNSPKTYKGPLPDESTRVPTTFNQDFNKLGYNAPIIAPYNTYNASNTFSLPGVRLPSENSYRSPQSGTVPKMSRHQRNRSSKSPKGRARSRLHAQRYRDVSEDSSEVEFFTANSYSDADSSADWLANMRKNPHVPVQDLATNDLINVGSSEDEISVVFTSVSPSSRSGEQRRGSARTMGRRHTRGSRRHISNPQDVVSLSPDPVEQVRQMEEDERFARMLQAQFDAEVDPTYLPRRRISPDPALMVMPELSSTSESDSMDLEVLPETPPVIFGLINHFTFGSPMPPRARNFRARRPLRRRWSEEQLSFPTNYLTRLVSGAFDSSDDSYEAFLNLAELNRDVPRGLQRVDINRLPTRKYVNMNGASASGAELPHKRAELNKECQVCLSDYVNGDVLRILPCFHEFHTPCIDPWLKINHTCPVCRVTVDLGGGEYEN